MALLGVFLRRTFCPKCLAVLAAKGAVGHTNYPGYTYGGCSNRFMLVAGPTYAEKRPLTAQHSLQSTMYMAYSILCSIQAFETSDGQQGFPVSSLRSNSLQYHDVFRILICSSGNHPLNFDRFSLINEGLILVVEAAL
jgi:hypothetical protein